MFQSPLVRRAIPGPLLLTVAIAAAGLAAQSTESWRRSATTGFPLAGGDYSNQRFSALDRINVSNIKTLGGAWSHRLEAGEEATRLTNLEGTPIVVDGTMYVTTSERHVLAINAKTGVVQWRYRPAGPRQGG